MKKIILSTLGVFSLAVAAIAFAASSIAINWQAPTTYVDGSTLDPASEILQYKIYYGTESGNYTQEVVVGADARSYTFSGLSGTYYFVATATSVELEESDFSNEISRKFSKGKPSTFTISFGS